MSRGSARLTPIALRVEDGKKSQSSIGIAASEKTSETRAKRKTNNAEVFARSRGAKFVGYGGHALAPRQQPPLNRSKLHGQAVQRIRDLPSSHSRALQPREERDVRGRAPHPCEMKKRAIACERGVGLVSARSRSGRDRVRVACAKRGQLAREVREGTARRGETLGVDDRGEWPRSRVVRPPEGTHPHSRMLPRPTTPRIFAPIGSRKRARGRTCALFRLRDELTLVGRALMHLQHVA